LAQAHALFGRSSTCGTFQSDWIGLGICVFGAATAPIVTDQHHQIVSQMTTHDSTRCIDFEDVLTFADDGIPMRNMTVCML
jgi:hypothetical protein